MSELPFPFFFTILDGHTKIEGSSPFWVPGEERAWERVCVCVCVCGYRCRKIDKDKIALILSNETVMYIFAGLNVRVA